MPLNCRDLPSAKGAINQYPNSTHNRECFTVFVHVASGASARLSVDGAESLYFLEILKVSTRHYEHD